MSINNKGGFGSWSIGPVGGKKSPEKPVLESGTGDRAKNGSCWVKP